MGKVTIDTERYLQLLNASDTLNLLEAGGVDNWGFHGESLYGDHLEQTLSDLEELNAEFVKQEEEKQL